MRGYRRFRLRLPSLSKRPGIPRLRLSRLWVWLILLVAASYLAVRITDLLVMEPLMAVAEVEARARGIDAVNRVVLGSLGRNLGHEDIVTYEKDKDGRIAAYHINTQLVNAVASEAASAVTQEFKELQEDSFGVPMGALSGARVLSSSGPAIPVRLIPIGTVGIDLKQEFTAEGINQTRHRIWIHATARMQVVLPVATREVEVSADLPLSETVIVGPVPSSFYGDAKLDGLTIPTTR